MVRWIKLKMKLKNKLIMNHTTYTLWENCPCPPAIKAATANKLFSHRVNFQVIITTWLH